MLEAAEYYTWKGEDLLLWVTIQPNAKNSEISGLHDNTLKLRIQAPAVEGKANLALITFLAKEFGVPAKSVKILKGLSSRKKQILIHKPQQLLPNIKASH
ncbi:MAG: DUF167 family protein [Gammaproteobacteria bacterium]|nr:DUF167 family protein [Gammaproteobacteria bacterium]